jgi:hypothetical protein
MSTVSTQINWGASYLVSDFYRRFVSPEADQRHLTRVSRLASLLILSIGSVAAYLMRDTSVDEAWKFLAALGGGTGAVFMLRWYWWRINAWSEIVAMVASLGFFVVVSRFVESNEYRLALVAALTIAAWLAATFLTSPERQETLTGFYRRVRPGGPGWRPIARLASDIEPDRHLGLQFLAAALAAGIVYFTLPGLGHLIFGSYGRSLLSLLAAVVCGLGVWLVMRRVGWGQVVR